MNPWINEAMRFYQGFWLTESVGNNAFSFAERSHKKIYVAPLMKGDLDDLAVGDHWAFSEILDGREANCLGLKNFLFIQNNQKDIFIFDNHNHAFFFWMTAFLSKRFPKGIKLVHVDQHSDLRVPSHNLNLSVVESLTFKDIFHYTNDVLNVGNFIKPALAAGIFSEVEIVSSRESFGKRFKEPIVLDLDLDIFAPSMDYIDFGLKAEAIQSYLQVAQVITIATSPFFMEQSAAIQIIKDLFSMDLQSSG